MGGLRNKIPFTYWMMVIGTLALTGFPFTAGYFSKDAIIEAAYAGKNPFAPYAFACTVIAALLTAFYSWRLIFMTFHGKPHDQHHYEEAHESPWVMLMPLIVLAIGSIAAPACRSTNTSSATTSQEFFRQSIAFAKGNTILDEMHHVPNSWCSLPTVMMAVGFAVAYSVLYPRSAHPGPARRAASAALPLPAQQVVLRRTVRLHLRAPDHVARPHALEERRRLADRRLRARRRVGPRARRHAQRGAAADRLSLSLRLRHADRRRRADHLVHVCGALTMASWPILSVVTFLPLVGALFILTLRGDDESVKRNARWVALWTTIVTFAVSLILVWRFDPTSAEFQFVEKRAGWPAIAITPWASTASRCRWSS